jgi:outer membrane protein assembly factor BamB
VVVEQIRRAMSSVRTSDPPWSIADNLTARVTAPIAAETLPPAPGIPEPQPGAALAPGPAQRYAWSHPTIRGCSVIPTDAMRRGLRFGTLLVALPALAAARQSAGGLDWTRFGYDAGRSSAPSAPMGVTAANLGSLRRRQVQLDGTVDASAIYLHAAHVMGETRDVFFVTTTYGKTLAIDADSGTILWRYTPRAYGTWSSGYRITTATPVADPDRAFIYAAAPDGMIRKLAVEDGRAVWKTAITRLPEREKIAASLNFFRGRVIATTGGYIGDAPPYQGHVAVLDAATGRLIHVWNALCSDRRELMRPRSCDASDAAIWGRAGAVVDTATGHLFVATGNGPWDGRTSWGDATLELDADATAVVGNYTPTNTEELEATDADLGSTSPVLLGGGLVAQGGKDGRIRLLEWPAMRGAAPHRGGERQVLATPSGDDLFTAPAVATIGGATWLFAADNRGTAAWTLRGGRLMPMWQKRNAGTSPVVADGLVFVYDPRGGLRVYEARSGRLVANLECGRGHWNSPIVVDGRIALPEGNANSQRTSGVLDIWRVG